VLLSVFCAMLSLPVLARDILIPGNPYPVTAPLPDVASFHQSDACIATDGDAFLAVWIDQSMVGRVDVHGTRITAEGKRIGDSVLAVAATEEAERRVAIAFDGHRYLVVWSTGAAVRGRFIDRDGVMSSPFLIAATADIRRSPTSRRRATCGWPRGASTSAPIAA
jgi:hypothetical protein